MVGHVALLRYNLPLNFDHRPCFCSLLLLEDEELSRPEDEELR